MRFRLILASLAMAILGVGVLTPSATDARAADAGLAVTGTVSGERGEETFVGVASDLVFAVQGGEIVLAGELAGTITYTDGATIEVDRAFAAVVAVRAGAECGELLVDVAAIVVVETGASIDLHGFALETAASGAGGLIGGLLGEPVCELTRLLENPLKLRRLVNELNDALEDELR